MSDSDRDVLLGEASSHRSWKPRWFEIRIFAVEGGYRVTGVGKTTEPGETDRSWEAFWATPGELVRSLYRYDPQQGQMRMSFTNQQALGKAMSHDPELKQAWQSYEDELANSVNS